jgi:hypothetical protein
MRPVIKTTGATGPSGWVPIDYLQASFGIGFRCTIGGATGPSMTYKVQHAFSSCVPDTEIVITRSTTTATLVFKAINGADGAAWVNHGLSTSDWIEVWGAGAPLDGTYAVASVTDSRTITYTVANSGVAANTAGSSVQRLFVGDHPVVTGLTSSSDGNYAFPPNRVRTNITTYGSGSLTLSLNQGL